MNTLTKQATVEDAIRLASFFSLFKQVNEVLLFGSLVTKGKGNDVDLIVEATGKLAYPFLDQLEALREPYGSHQYRQLRFELACSVFDLVPTQFVKFCMVKADIFVLPPGWSHNARVSDVLNNRDKDFVRTLKTTARCYYPDTGNFLGY